MASGFSSSRVAWDTIALYLCNGLLTLSLPYIVYMIVDDTDYVSDALAVGTARHRYSRSLSCGGAGATRWTDVGVRPHYADYYIGESSRRTRSSGTSGARSVRLEQETTVSLDDGRRHLVGQQNLYLLITLWFWVVSSLLDYQQWWLEQLRNLCGSKNFVLHQRLEKAFLALQGFLFLAWAGLVGLNLSVILEEVTGRTLHTLAYMGLAAVHLLCQVAALAPGRG